MGAAEKLAPMMSSNSDDWNTPECVLELVRKVGSIALDPCSNAQSIVGAELEIMQAGLSFRWNEEVDNCEDDLVWCNPPYSDVWEWVNKCNITYFMYGTPILALVPARTDTRWFQTCWDSKAICFWKGRIKFLGGKHSAPFPSAVVYWGPNKYRFADAFASAGKIVFP